MCTWLRHAGAVAGWILLATLVSGQVPPPDSPPTAETQPVSKPVSSPASLPTTLVPPPPPPPAWTGGLEVGLLGATGNSDNFRFRFGFNAKQDTPDHLWVADLVYNYAEAFGTRNENRAMFNTRYEWKLGDPWSLFASGQVEYDEFRAFDVRIAAHAGVAYAFIRSDRTQLKGRLGAGASRELGGPNEDWIPEALFGLDFEHHFSAKTKFVANFDYFPNLGDWTDYRWQLRASLETVLVEEWDLSLKLGIFDRYDSTPEGRRPNDLEYFAVLLWKF